VPGPALCRRLAATDRLEPLALDLTRLERLTEGARGCAAVACAAGPFQALPPALPAAVVAAGAHWLDIADDPTWLLPLLADRGLSATAAAAGLAVLPGLSTTPALSGVLVRWGLQRLPHARRARVTLFIGNRNAKGAGAVASLLSAHPGDARRVRLPVGRSVAHPGPIPVASALKLPTRGGIAEEGAMITASSLRFDTADAALLRQELGIAAEFRVAFEWGAAGRLVAALAPLGARLGASGRLRLARVLSCLARPFGRAGSDRGYIQAELRDGAGGRVMATFAAGQRLAVLPCALAVEALLSGELAQRGVVHPAIWLPPDAWISRLGARGVSFRATVSPSLGSH
jgi:hypothetical protein